jgi:hypothetical protein
MALSATFTANFSSFYDAVAKADAQLKDFGEGADKVGGRLNTLANQFTGKKIIQEATLMAKAVEDIGGTSMLTERELGRLGATASEAVAKMKALGMEVPKNLQEIADKTKNANQATSDWTGSLVKVAGAIGIAFSVDAIKGFIGSVFDAASAVKDLSDQWGVSTTAVQQWTGAAKASGVEAETVGKSVQFLTEQLGDGSDAYQALLKNVGLSYDELRKMPLEDAYKQVVAAIGGIKDETLQLDIAQGLLGTSSKKMVGAIRDGFLEAADAQKVMSDETIKRLEAAQASWERFTNAVIVYSGEALAAVMDDTKRMTSSWGNFFRYLNAAAQGAGAVAMLIEQDKALEKTNQTMKATVSTTETFTVAGTKMESGLKTTAQVLEEGRKKTEALKTAEQRRTQAQEAAKKAQEDYTKGLASQNQKLLDLVNTFEGRDLIGKANLYLEALKDSIPVQTMTAEQQANINKVMVDAIKVYDAAGEEAPQALYDMWAATVKADQATVQYAEDLSKLKAPPISFDLPNLGPGIKMGLPPPTELEQWNKSVHELAGAFAQLAQISDGAFSDIAQDIGTLIGAMDLAGKSTKTFQTGIASFKAGNLTQGFAQSAAGAAGVISSFQSATKETGKLQSTLNGAAIGFSVAGPWGAAVGAGIGLLKGFLNAAKAAREVRNLRDDFLAAAGGAEELRDRAYQAGVSLDDLYAAKKKGDLEAAIKDINAAFKYQEDALNMVTEAAQRYGFTLEELGPALQRQELDKQAQQLYKDFELLTSAGIDSIAVNERMSEAVSKYVQDAKKMGLEVPEAMRPMLETFAKSGTLLDENGNAITDLEDAGLSFSMTMSEGFKKLIEQVEKLTDVISKTLTGAINDIPPVQVPVPGVNVPYNYRDKREYPSYQEGTDGFRNFGTGTPVMLHGWEAVVPREESGAFATVAAAPMMAAVAAPGPTIVINAQGALFDSPSDLQRLADRVNDALTAKYGIRNAMRAG